MSSKTILKSGFPHPIMPARAGDVWCSLGKLLQVFSQHFFLQSYPQISADGRSNPHSCSSVWPQQMYVLTEEKAHLQLGETPSRHVTWSPKGPLPSRKPCLLPVVTCLWSEERMRHLAPCPLPPALTSLDGADAPAFCLAKDLGGQ